MTITAAILALALTSSATSFYEAAATIERAQIASRDCDWAMKTDDRLERCDTFYRLSIHQDDKIRAAMNVIVEAAQKAEDENNTDLQIRVMTTTRRMQDITQTLALLHVFMKEGRYTPPAE